MDSVRYSLRSISGTAASIGLLAMSLLSPALAVEYSEDAVKAAYLYRFAGYIDWPNRASMEKPFSIEVLGAPGVARELRRLLPGHLINGQVAQVREITATRDLGNPQIVYIGPGHAELLRSLPPQSSSASMLLVTDEEGGLSSGSTLNFLTIDRNVRFEVSLSAAERHGLKISSELLGVAVRVQGRTGQSFLGCASTIINAQAPCGSRVARGLRNVVPKAGPSG